MKILSKSCSKAPLIVGMLSLLASSAYADSLWRSEVRISLISDKKAHSVGDIITVVVQESNTVKKDAKTQTSKATDMDASLKSFLFSPAASGLMTKGGKLPAMAMTSKNTFDGGGSINNSESMQTRFAVTVQDVLPNGNLIVSGLRQTASSGESQTVVLRGTLRPYDVTPNNTVFSYNLADVSIKFTSSGALSNSQNKGWFSRAWDALTPF